MDPILNPFAPGAGAPPPELAGRGELRELVRIALERIRLGRPNKSILMVGLRGVGKTVLLDRMRDDAESSGIHSMRIEAPEGRSLPAFSPRNFGKPCYGYREMLRLESWVIGRYVHSLVSPRHSK